MREGARGFVFELFDLFMLTCVLWRNWQHIKGLSFKSIYDFVDSSLLFSQTVISFLIQPVRLGLPKCPPILKNQTSLEKNSSFIPAFDLAIVFSVLTSSRQHKKIIKTYTDLTERLSNLDINFMITMKSSLKSLTFSCLDLLFHLNHVPIFHALVKVIVYPLLLILAKHKPTHSS